MEYIYMRIKIRQKKRLVPPIFILAKLGVEYTYGTPMSVLPSFAERKR